MASNEYLCERPLGPGDYCETCKVSDERIDCSIFDEPAPTVWFKEGDDCPRCTRPLGPEGGCDECHKDFLLEKSVDPINKVFQ